MKKEDFTNRVNEMCAYVNQHEYDDMSEELKGRGIPNPLAYGAWCERNFELNLREDYKRKTTYTADFSVAEWFVPKEGMSAIANTLRHALNDWQNDVKFFAEVIMVVNMKSWEHAARGNNKYGMMYSDLYYMVRDLYFDWFDETHPKHNEAGQYYMAYVD